MTYDDGGQFDAERGDEFFPDFALPPIDVTPPGAPRDPDDDDVDCDAQWELAATACATHRNAKAEVRSLQLALEALNCDRHTGMQHRNYFKCQKLRREAEALEQDIQHMADTFNDANEVLSTYCGVQFNCQIDPVYGPYAFWPENLA